MAARRGPREDAVRLGGRGQASWTDPGATDATWTCGGSSYLTELRFHECVKRTLTSPDTEWVQSVMLVTNVGATARAVTGNTETFAGPGRGYHLSYGDCGATVVAGPGHRWCYGQSKAVVKGTPIYGIGELFQAGESSFAYSPTPFTAPIPPKPPPPPGPCTDCDADGYLGVIDCADGDPAIHPGSVDVPGNGVDEDCSGTDAPVPVLDAAIPFSFAWFSRASYTVVRRLAVEPVAAGTRVRLRCSGGGCPFRSKTRSVVRHADKLDLLPFLRHAKLKPRARLEVQVTKPGTIGRSRVFTMRSGKLPKQTDRCLTARARPVRCPR
jgi:hypothetical protein